MTIPLTHDSSCFLFFFAGTTFLNVYIQAEVESNIHIQSLICPNEIQHCCHLLVEHLPRCLEFPVGSRFVEYLLISENRCVCRFFLCFSRFFIPTIFHVHAIILSHCSLKGIKQINLIQSSFQQKLSLSPAHNGQSFIENDTYYLHDVLYTVFKMDTFINLTLNSFLLLPDYETFYGPILDLWYLH